MARSGQVRRNERVVYRCAHLRHIGFDGLTRVRRLYTRHILSNRVAFGGPRARSGTPIDQRQDAGGWASPSMPLRYVEAARIANEGVRLSG